MTFDSKEAQEIVFLSNKLLDMNKRLIESEKAKSRFLSLVANELNNPMTALLGLIPHLKPDHLEENDIFSLAHQEALLLNFRIQNLVAAAEVESGEVEVSYVSVNVESIVHDVVKDLHYLIHSKNIIISIHNTLESSIVSDPRKLHLILKNIIANGCTYGFINGIVDIAISESSSTLKISINNQGYPPKVEFKPEIFTRFANGPEGEHGLGIGLSIVRELCECMEGSIDYVAANRMVTFTVTLPLLKSTSESDLYGSNEFLFESFDNAIEL
jgi:signal transduction histidine kinase